MIRVQREDFDHAYEYNALRNNDLSDGAIVTFTGLVRDMSASGELQGMELEHYPGMTEKALEDIVTEARSRWTLGEVRVIHRVGKLENNEQIVFVGVSSKHRDNAFEACRFIMDILKTQAPFWKKEFTESGHQWVEAKETDTASHDKWYEPKS